jgi:poly(A) polymerase Pap1
MRQQGCYETRKGLEARQEVLACLNPLVREWIKSIGLGRRMQWHNVDNIGGRIVTYGSYMLGIVESLVHRNLGLMKRPKEIWRMNIVDNMVWSPFWIWKVSISLGYSRCIVWTQFSIW